ncbi:MAG: protein kinase [Myxococcota bacterium]
MTEPTRYCPLCELRTEAERCPEDGVRTLAVNAPPHERPPLSVGAVVDGRYRVERVLGVGAMGAVYAATQLWMDRAVALKALHQPGLTDPVALKRFYHEAKNASRIRDPHVVETLDFGVDEASGMPFFVMELVPGRTLRDIFNEEGPLPLPRLARLLEQACRGLSAAHARSIVHRDLKPANLLVQNLDGEEQLKIADFGIAKAMTPRDEAAGQLTETGVAMGTPRYMAPEQVEGRAVDGRTDLYALGCILFEGLTGKLPFMGETPIMVMMRHATEARPVLSAPELEPPLEAAVARLHETLMARDPAGRPSDPDAVADALATLAGGEVPDLGFLPAGFPDSGVPDSGSLEVHGDGRSAVADAETLVPTKTPRETTPDRATEAALAEAGEPAPTRRPVAPRARVLVLAGVVLVLAGVALVGVGILARSRVGSRSIPIESPAALPSPARTAAEPSPPQPAPAELTPSPGSSGEALASDALPELVQLRFNGRPASTQLFELGRAAPRCARLPCSIEVPRSNEVLRLRASAQHFLDRTIEVRPDRPRNVVVRLRPQLAAPSF